MSIQHTPKPVIVPADGNLRAEPWGGAWDIDPARPIMRGAYVTAAADIPASDLIQTETFDRTPAGPLQQLEIFLAGHLQLSRALLVCHAGRELDHGSVALFARTAAEAAVDLDSWYVASYDARAGRFSVIMRYGEPAARHTYTQRQEELA